MPHLAFLCVCEKLYHPIKRGQEAGETQSNFFHCFEFSANGFFSNIKACPHEIFDWNRHYPAERIVSPDWLLNSLKWLSMNLFKLSQKF